MTRFMFTLGFLAIVSVFAADSYMNKDAYASISGQICRETLNNVSTSESDLKKLASENKAVYIKVGSKVNLIDRDFTNYCVHIKFNANDYWVYEHEVGDIVKSIK